MAKTPAGQTMNGKKGAGKKNADPYLQCYFNVKIGSQLVGRFMSCSGIAYEMEMETYQEGGVNTGPHYFPVSLAPQRLVLERGVLTKDEMVAWLKAAEGGAYEKLDGQIELRDFRGQTLQTWTLQNAYPVKYEGPELNALSDSVAVTRIEIAYNGMLPVN